MHPQLLRGEDHEQRLAAALKVPDEALLRKPCTTRSISWLVAQILLVTADDLDAPMLLVRGEEREVLQDVQDHLGTQHGTDGALHIRQGAFGLVVTLVPGTQISMGIRTEP